jgi:hypothetical protein
MVFRVVVLACLLALSGCAVPPVSDTSPSNASPLGATTEPTSTYGPDDERAASPHEFVAVHRTQNQSKPETLPANATARFEELSREQRETFLKALDGGKVAAKGWDAFDESQPSHVYYEGTWYTVMVGVY